MDIRVTDTIGFIVAGNINTASVFNSYGVDFYSKGNRTVEHACIDENIPIFSLMEDLYELGARTGGGPDFNAMDMSGLSTYILRTHHTFTERRLIFLRNTISRLSSSNDTEDSKLMSIKKEFEKLSTYLTVHMKHEEFIIFPFIQKMVRAKPFYSMPFHEIEKPILAMKDDHEQEVSTLKRLARLTGNYEVSAHADYALRIAYNAMRELSEDLKIHMHLENNILFPKALDFATANTRHPN